LKPVHVLESATFVNEAGGGKENGGFDDLEAVADQEDWKVIK